MQIIAILTTPFQFRDIPSNASVADLSEWREYIDPYKSTHYAMKLIASFASRLPGKVKPVKKAIPLNAANFENFD